MKQLLLEIGTEEIPASFLGPALADLERRVRTALSDSDIPAGSAELFSTPRRLALRLNDVADGKPAQVVELQGPPKKAAFDPQGNPTKTAVGFSGAHGKTPADLYIKPTPRGEYVFVKKQADAVPTTKVLREGLPGILAALPFPKNMRWDATGVRFARPIRWLVCLFGDEVVEFEFGTLKSGADSRGLRNSLPASFPIPSPAEYESTLRTHGVVVPRDARRRTIATELNRLAAGVDGRPVEDEELLEETTDITESPELLLCSFNPDYLDLPPEVLTTALKKHQRCFSISKADTPGLLPRFVAVTNTPGCDAAAVSGWYEKAAESRLRDARFFVEADLKHWREHKDNIDALVEEEKQVTWIEGMGTYFDKTQRLRRLCEVLARVVPDIDAEALDRAALLSKADLLTNMVREKEFTSLQGRIGGIYARRLGESAATADAIAEHYLPRFIGDRLPQTRSGALLSIADKLYNIVAAFLTGKIPTGSEDPFGLRRQATGLLTIVLKQNLPIGIGDILQAAVPTGHPAKDEDAVLQIRGFFRERLNALLADEGIRYDIAAAVMETSWEVPAQAMIRATALSAYRDEPEFLKLVVGQKRVANILKGQTYTKPSTSLFTEPTEILLHEESQKVEPDLGHALIAHDYRHAFELLLSLRPTIDKFFDDVLVMAEDKTVRDNRLGLLHYVRSLFGRLADLSKIVIEGQ